MLVDPLEPTDAPRNFPARFNELNEAVSNATSGSGALIQKRSQAFTGSHEETTATSFQDTSVTMSVTPQYDDSILIVGVSFYAVALRVGSSTDVRWTRWQILNETDGVPIDGAETVAVGRVLTSATSNSATSLDAVALIGRYQVDSLTERAFRLRFHAPNADIRARLALGDSSAHMFIEEIRP